MKIKVTAITLTVVAFQGMTLDVPDEVVKEGSDAIVEWANAHIREVDSAPTEQTDTWNIREVTQIEHIKEMGK